MNHSIARAAVVSLVLPLLTFASFAQEVLARVEAIDRVDLLGLSVYAHLADAEGMDYILVVAEKKELEQSGWPFTVLTTNPVIDTLAMTIERMPGAGKAARGKLECLYDDGRHFILNLAPGQMESLVDMGFGVVKINAPVKWPTDTARSCAARAITPDATVAGLMATVQQATVLDLIAKLDGEAVATIGGEPYTILTRSTLSDTPIKKAEQFVAEQLQLAGMDVSYSSWNTESYSGQNVLGVKRGSTLPNEIVLVTAHIDNMPDTGDRALGADDNASGCVGVMLAANALKTCNTLRTIHFVCTSGEEQGLLGSKAFATAAYNAGANIVAVYNMDMIGYSTLASRELSLHTRRPSSPGYATDLAIANLFTDVVSTYGMTGLLTPNIVSDGDVASDHASFWHYGYSAIMAIESDNNVNPHYHTLQDDLSQINPAYCTDFIKASVGTIAHLAGVSVPATVPVAPTNVRASDGSYTNKVHVSWDTSTNAITYQIVRTRNHVTTPIAEVNTTYYDDTTISQGCVYTYKIVARNDIGSSAASAPDSGYANDPAITSPIVDLALWDIVVLPATMSAGAAPGLVSFKLENHGPDNLGLSTTNVTIKFYTSTTPAQEIGEYLLSAALTNGESRLVIAPRTALTNLALPATPGTYPICAVVSNTSGVIAFDPDTENNEALRKGSVSILAGSAAAYKGVNDYDGDSTSDLAIFDNNTGYWYVASLSEISNLKSKMHALRVLAWAVPWGWAGANPIYGDYDGDGCSDMNVFNTANGNWYSYSNVRHIDIIFGKQWGWSTAIMAPGDYDADGKSDLALFDSITGNWFIWSEARQTALAWRLAWGWAGARTVPGDYDGDGKSDMAVFDNLTGNWYVRTLAGTTLAWAVPWGWPGAVTVPGDYDGDGKSDMAVFDSGTGNWYVKSLDGTVIVWGTPWGWPSAIPVGGDFDGDGKSDLAVFDNLTGNWFIMSTDGRILLWARPWGWPGAVAVR